MLAVRGTNWNESSTAGSRPGQPITLAMLGVAVRMGGGLLLGLAAAFVLGTHDIQRAVIILIAAMPSAVNAVIYAVEANLDQDLVTSIVAISLCIGFAALPFLPGVAHFLAG